MNGRDLTETLRDDNETALSRLGSSKWVYALTGGEMESDRVRAAAAAEARAARETFGAWADDEADADAAEAFEAAAGTAAAHYDRIADDDRDPGEPRPMYEALADLDATVERAGGLLGWALVTGQTYGQMVGFFVGDADPQTADTVRDLRDDVEDEREAAADLLDSICDGDDWAAAEDAADAAVEAAYDDYVETLESMGIQPKNVC